MSTWGTATKTTLPTNAVLEWEYDAANRAIKAKRNGKDAFSYAYDENGNETQVTDHINGITREKAYDEGNRIISMTDRGGSVKWSYQPKSHKLKDTTINHGSYNNTTNYEYNALNQNTKVTDSGKTFYFDYDEFGNVVRYQAGNDTAAQFTYDHTKKLTNLQIGTKDSQRILEESYTYDATSNRTAIERKNGDKTEKTTYAYDAINQLTKETLPNGTSKEYSYDGFGNRIGIQVTEAGKSAVSTTAVFNDGNQLTKFGNESLTYDANGNRTSDGKYTYTWNEADQLVAITKQGESTPFATYKYDDDGRRIEKTVNGATTRYHYDGDSINPLYETDGSGNVLRQYVYSIDGIRLAMKSQGQTVYYHYNPRGDVIAMTDENGQVVATYEYDTWGNVLKSDAKGIAADNPFGYAGYMYDKEIGMYYLIARYYNPDHGVFLSVDPDPGDEDDPLTQNGYTYGDNNPVMVTDPDGHVPWLVINAGFAAYDAYGAYKSGKGWKGIGKAGLKGFVGGPRIKAVRQIGKVVQMKNAKNIRFTQDSIKGTFKNGKSVNNLANQMKNGKIRSRDLPPIKIFKHQGNIYSFDNRRLYAAKKAGVNVRTQWATAKEIQRELKKGKLSTKNNGKSIKVRGRR